MSTEKIAEHKRKKLKQRTIHEAHSMLANSGNSEHSNTAINVSQGTQQLCYALHNGNPVDQKEAEQ